MGSVTFNDKHLKQAIKTHGENVVKKFSADTFKEIVKTSPQKDTLSDSGKYRRTGTLRDGWNIKKRISGGMEIFNETFYAPYFEYGHRLRGGGIIKGAYLMSNAIDKMLKKYNLKATRKGGL